MLQAIAGARGWKAARSDVRTTLLPDVALERRSDEARDGGDGRAYLHSHFVVLDGDVDAQTVQQIGNYHGDQREQLAIRQFKCRLRVHESHRHRWLNCYCVHLTLLMT